MSRHRLGLVAVTPDHLLDLLGVPKSMRINGHRGIHYDFDSDTFHIKLEHESFEEHVEFQRIPFVDIKLK